MLFFFVIYKGDFKEKLSIFDIFLLIILWQTVIIGYNGISGLTIKTEVQLFLDDSYSDSTGEEKYEKRDKN